MNPLAVIAYALILLGGLGGVAACFLHISMIDSLNSRRAAPEPPDTPVTWSDLILRPDSGGSRPGILFEFHHEFPQDPRYFRYLASVVSMLVLGIGGFVLLISQ